MTLFFKIQFFSFFFAGCVRIPNSIISPCRVVVVFVCSGRGVMNREGKKGELMVEKLKSVGKKREGNSTPSPTWKLGLSQPDGTLIQDPTHTQKPNLSARELGANLWEMHPLEIMTNKTHPNSTPRRDANQPSTSGSRLKKQIESSQAQHNRRVEKIGQAQQPLSSASYTSSMEMSPYRVSPRNSSFMSKGKFVESSHGPHGLKTSTELLKVLNRIWSLEEKHALDMSLVKALRTELGQSQDQIQELLEEKHRDQKEINNLTAKIGELKVVRKKDQDRIKDAINLLEEKLKNELKSRRHTEKHHHKQAKELSDIKNSLSNALEELEREKKSRGLLEDLCDEFAKGIRDYEHEIRFMKQKSSEDRVLRKENDRFILHISEAWLDERTQMKLADTSEKQSPLDKLRAEIETFLREKKSGNANEEKADDNDDDEASVGIMSNRSLKQEYGFARQKGRFGKFALDNLGTGRRSLKEGTRNSIITDQARVDLQATARDSSASFLEGSFDPSMFTGPTSPVKKWVSRISAAEEPEMGESSSRWTKGVKPNTLKAKLAEARLKGPMSRARTSRSLSTKARTQDV